MTQPQAKPTAPPHWAPRLAQEARLRELDRLLARTDCVPFGEAWLTEKGLVWAAELLLNDPPSLTRTAYDAANDNSPD